ncbi:serine hydrolase domain-containing protein [Neptunitalea lumnitzerae]|nr:serine hydrolase domain-containing protein [Neptunitalea sp. Y10]
MILQVHCARQIPVSSNQIIPVENEAVTESERIVSELLIRKKIPGLAVVVTKKDSVIWKAGYGYANVRKAEYIDPDKSLFRVASISKPISAVGLMKMYEDGIIDINASVYKYVPDFPRKKYDFTIKQLAAHTAGIRTYRGNEFLNRKYMTIKDGLSFFDKDTLMYQPGKGYLYNSNDWNLVAVAMENASTLDFEYYMKNEIFKPLGLTHIIADKSENLEDKVVFYTKRGRRGRFKIASKVNNYYKLASGGYLASASDIAKFGNDVLYNRILQPKSKKVMLTRQEVNDEPTYYGLGWEVSLDKRHRHYYGHFGNGVGGYGYFYVYPEEEMVFVFLTNITNPGINDAIDEIMDIMILGNTTEENPTK